MLSVRGCLWDWHVGAQVSPSHEPPLSELGVQLRGPFRAHGWRARVCHSSGRNSVWGMAVPKVESPGHPGHPPPLSDAVVKWGLFNTVKMRSTGVVSSHWFSSSVVSLACITSVRSIHCFPGGHSLHLAFGSFFYNHPLSRPLYFPLINQYDRCLVPLVRGLMAGGHRFASHRGTALSRGWLCQKGKFLDTPGTHLH